MVDFLLVILLSDICTHGWIGLEEGNKGIENDSRCACRQSDPDTVRRTLFGRSELYLRDSLSEEFQILTSSKWIETLQDCSRV
jgi:hypothetical protein